jgi:formylglycine-generating enzyme required for sulfatase activity
LTDNGDGTYQSQYTAAGVGGNVKITASTSGGLSQSVSVQVLDVSKDKSSIKAVGKIALPTGEEGKVEVTVIGPSGKPVAGRQVRLTADPSDKFAVKSSTVTDANGVATVTFTAGKSGARILKASVNGVELAASVAFMFTGEEFDRFKWMEMAADKKWEKDGSLMALIPAGSFEMGDHLDGMSSALPVHTVELDAFYMDVHEVTVGQFKQFVNETGYSYDRWNRVATYAPGDEYPMVYVSWNDATAYAKWAGKRLPTEAEWEYAARGGLVGKRYPGGDEISHDDANYGGKVGKARVVGSYPANGYGLYDMAGNVWEWCQDWYGSDYYSNSPTKNPPGPDTGSYRVLRGGSWTDHTYYLRVASRGSSYPDIRRDNYGFRCVSGSN